MPDGNLLDKYQLDSYGELQQHLWQLGTTPNGVFGVKTGAYNPYFRNLIDAFKQFPGCNTELNNPVEIWHNTFPNCKHIYMTRRNKVRLAVSWWKAIQTQEWHCRRGQLPKSDDLQDKYSYEAIAHLFAECSMREAAIQEFFDKGSIVPHTVVYQDFVLNYEPAIRSILNFLQLPNTGKVAIPPPPLQQLADDVSENWVQKFRQEKQREWQNYW